MVAGRGQRDLLPPARAVHHFQIEFPVRIVNGLQPRFHTRADRPLPVAAAAQVAQYRNRYWNFVKNARLVRCMVVTDGNR